MLLYYRIASNVGEICELQVKDGEMMRNHFIHGLIVEQKFEG